MQLGWERKAPTGAFGGNMNAMALVQHSAALGVTTAGFPGAWKAENINRAGGTVNGPDEVCFYSSLRATDLM